MKNDIVVAESVYSIINQHLVCCNVWKIIFTLFFLIEWKSNTTIEK